MSCCFPPLFQKWAESFQLIWSHSFTFYFWKQINTFLLPWKCTLIKESVDFWTRNKTKHFFFVVSMNIQLKTPDRSFTIPSFKKNVSAKTQNLYVSALNANELLLPAPFSEVGGVFTACHTFAFCFWRQNNIFHLPWKRFENL